MTQLVSRLYGALGRKTHPVIHAFEGQFHGFNDPLAFSFWPSAAEGGPAARFRLVLTEWSELAAETGDHATAYRLSRRALDLR
jgi:hypothetical protein